MADDDEDDEAWVDEAWMDEVVESPSSRGANRPAETGIFDLDADDASLANQLSKRINYHSKALNLAALQAAQERRARGASPLLVEPPKVKDADANADANNASSNLPDLLHEQREQLPAFLSEYEDQLPVLDITINPHSLPGKPLYDRFFAAWEKVPDKSMRLVFHGTHEDNIEKICVQGLDPNLRRGQALGPGEYFGAKPGLSLGYCKGGRKMLVFCILTDPSGVTKIDGRGGGVAVIHKSDHQLPLAVVTFDEVKAQEKRRAWATKTSHFARERYAHMAKKPRSAEEMLQSRVASAASAEEHMRKVWARFHAARSATEPPPQPQPQPQPPPQPPPRPPTRDTPLLHDLLLPGTTPTGPTDPYAALALQRAGIDTPAAVPEDTARAAAALGFQKASAAAAAFSRGHLLNEDWSQPRPGRVFYPLQASTSASAETPTPTLTPTAPFPIPYPVPPQVRVPFTEEAPVLRPPPPVAPFAVPYPPVAQVQPLLYPEPPAPAPMLRPPPPTAPFAVPYPPVAQVQLPLYPQPPMPALRPPPPAWTLGAVAVAAPPPEQERNIGSDWREGRPRGGAHGSARAGGFGNSRWGQGGGGPMRRPPATYICNRCKVGGHWISECPTLKKGKKRPWS